MSANPSDATATANDGNVEVPGTSSSQTDADIFDAFTREDASSETREPFDDSRMEDADQVAAHVEMDQEDETAVRERPARPHRQLPPSLKTSSKRKFQSPVERTSLS